MQGSLRDMVKPGDCTKQNRWSNTRLFSLNVITSFMTCLEWPLPEQWDISQRMQFDPLIWIRLMSKGHVWSEFWTDVKGYRLLLVYITIGNSVFLLIQVEMLSSLLVASGGYSSLDNNKKNRFSYIANFFETENADLKFL